MSKFFFILVLIKCGATIFSSAQDFDSLMASGKEVFNNPYSTEEDYNRAAKVYTAAMLLQPDNPITHYYLGYSLERSEIIDATSMLSTSAQHTSTISKCFEKAIELNPKYNGPFVALDPYSKIQSVWASLAMKYYHDNKSDSVTWAFAEGKRRGGFRSMMIEHARLLLDDCSENSILITSGDYIFFPIFYLQQVQHYRKDVTVIDAGLCHTFWYPAMLREKGLIKFTLPQNIIDTIGYAFWEEVQMTIPIKNNGKNLTWIVKPTYEGVVLLRNSRVLLDMLRANEFVKDVYLYSGVPEEDILSLHNHLQSIGALYKVSQSITGHSMPNQWEKYIDLVQFVDGNSHDEKTLITAVRHYLLTTSLHLIDDNKSDAKKLYKQVLTNIPERDYPFDDLSSTTLKLLTEALNN
jgi:tetratricopeptide (TPR) repeat protein